MKRTNSERLLSLVDVNENGCWIWNGDRVTGGYGRINVERKNILTHRLSYEIFVGTIPKGHDVHHECHEPSCCNPAHLSVMLIAEHRRMHHVKEECKRGHHLIPENVYQRPGSPTRWCRACLIIRQKEYRTRHPEVYRAQQQRARQRKKSL